MPAFVRGTGIWDIKDKAEVMRPDGLDWDERDAMQMPKPLQFRLLRCAATEKAIHEMINGR